MRMARTFFLPLLLSLSLHPAAAQTIDISAFFQQSLNAYSQAFSDQGDVLSDGLPGLGPLEKLELRTETDRFDPGRQEYTLRLSPAGRGKVRAQKALAGHLARRPNFEGEASRCEDLARRYGDWIKLYQIEEELAVLAELELIQADQRIVLNRQSARLDFDWQALIDLRKSQTELSIRSAGLQQVKVALLARNGLTAEVNLSFAGMPQPSRLPERVADDLPIAIDGEDAFRLQTIERELALEQAEKRQYFDFAQFRYNGPHDDFFRDRFTVGVGLQFPNLNSQQLKVFELQAERQARAAEQSADESEDRGELDRELAGLRQAVEHYAFLEENYRAEAEELATIAERLSSKDGFNPLPLLEIKEREQRNALKLLDRHLEVLEDYLEIRVLSGEVCGMTSGELFL